MRSLRVLFSAKIWNFPEMARRTSIKCKKIKRRLIPYRYPQILIQLMKKKKKIYLYQDIIAKRVELLLQNASYFFITERRSFFNTKYVNLITKCSYYYKMPQFYCKTRQVLQNALIIAKRGITSRRRNVPSTKKH